MRSSTAYRHRSNNLSATAPLALLTDTILGAINVYLMIAFAFMFLHESVLMVCPDFRVDKKT